MTIAAWCLPVVFLLIYLPRFAAIRGAIAQEGDYDIINPRAQEARLEGRAARAQAAHMNAVECFAPFAAAVWVAHAFDADPTVRDGLAVAFVLSRVVYIPAYLNDWGYGRTGVWAVGWFATIALFILPVF